MEKKTYKHANNICVKISYLGRNLCKILLCFVKKASNVAISRILVAFFNTFWNFLLLFGFFALFGSFRPFTPFCHKLDLSHFFKLNHFVSNLARVKKLSFSISALSVEISAASWGLYMARIFHFPKLSNSVRKQIFYGQSIIIGMLVLWTLFILYVYFKYISKVF